jgi:hypothetical protein
MSQTIRDYIKRRVRWLFGMGIVGWLMFPVSEFAGGDRGPGAVSLAVVGMLVFAGAILALNYFVKCPKCRANLGRTVAVPIALSFGSGPKVNFCPYCGVNLDEPMPHAPVVVESQNPIK